MTYTKISYRDVKGCLEFNTLAPIEIRQFEGDNTCLRFSLVCIDGQEKKLPG